MLESILPLALKNEEIVAVSKAESGSYIYHSRPLETSLINPYLYNNEQLS